MLLYVHVPFCRSKCRYCGFHSQIFDPEALEVYQRALISEIKARAAALGRVKLTTVYFGGGTPSLIPWWSLEKIIAAIAKHFEWPSGIEASFEANPESCNDVGYLRSLAASGFNRLSLGVQSFGERDLALLGRPHDQLMALTAFDAARAAGFRNIGLDLIWGLPGQRLRLWLEQLKSAVSLKPEHLSCYGLTLEPGTWLASEVKAGRISLPDEKEQAQMFVRGANFLEENGYLQYEISNFARMGLQSRHNSGYWQGLDYLGLGPAAVSTLSGKRGENPKNLEEYARLARAGKLGQNAVGLSLEERCKERLMLGLRTAAGVSLAEFKSLSGRDLASEQPGLLAGLGKHGLARVKDGRLYLTRNGMLVSNLIIERLIFPAGQAQTPTG